MDVYVPSDPDDNPFSRGAAIVGVRTRDGIRVATSTPKTPRDNYADLVSQAAQQLRHGHGGQLVDAEALRLVGYFNEGTRVVNLRDSQSAARWVGRPLYRNDLEASDSPHQQRMDARRELRRALITGNQAQAARIVSRHGWPGL